MNNEIKIRGARTHNLKNINLDIPREKLVVLTGLSGSGKSSLAFDTLYAEGQRRYVESLSAYARQFLQLMEKPDVDTIEGLSPAISIEQKATSHNPRSTVGTVTEIHDYLRLLFARAGTPHCPDHDLPLEAQSVSQMVDTVLAMPEDTKLMILAPVVSERKGEFVDLFQDLQAQGFVRFRVRSGGGTTNTAKAEIFEVDQLPTLKKNDKHSIEVVVDRIKVRPDIQQRVAESFETALRLADGKAMIVNMDTGKEMIFSSKFACPICSYSLQELEPRLFSFNNPMGACPSCDGLGHQSFFDPKRIVAHPDLSLASGAIKGWDRRNQFYFKLLQTLAKHGLDLIDPALSQAVLAAMLLSMFGAPFLIEYSDRIAMRFSSNEWLLQSLALTRVAAKSVRTENHVVICGFGRSGQSLARMLDQEKIPYIALDMDPDRVKEAAAAGDNVVYGDASRENYLVAAGLSRAKAVVITYADTPATLKVLHQVERLRPGMTVLVRTKDDVDEAMFLGGLSKSEFLREFEPDFFFDDQTGHCQSAASVAPTGHVVSGVSNKPKS
jgi:ABC-type dipeptide/oligopeptide/nickel transport system ATPase subunit